MAEKTEPPPLCGLRLEGIHGARRDDEDARALSPRRE